MKFIKFFLLLFIVLSSEFSSIAEKRRIAFIGSLTGFAGAYGTASLEGVRLAVKEANAEGANIELLVEDDASLAKNLALAYQKIRAQAPTALITGTWWANSIVGAVRADQIPFLSCDTLENKDYIQAPNHYLLEGDLKDWIRVFEPLIEERGWKRAVMIKFTSGFAETLAEEFTRVFSQPGRRLLKTLEYNDIDMRDAGRFAIELKKLQPDVVYVDSQPAGFARFFSELSRLKDDTIVVLSNSNMKDAFSQKLITPGNFAGRLFYSSRVPPSRAFQEKFLREYNRYPDLNADLGYRAIQILRKARINPDGSLEFEGKNLEFNERNVATNDPQQVNRID